MKIAFVGSFAAQLAEPVRAHLSSPCEIVVDADERMGPQIADASVVVAMSFGAQLAEAVPQLRLLQVPGAGLDRIERTALRPGTLLANVYGHEVGIAEYTFGMMIALSRSFAQLDRALRQGRWESQWAIGSPPPPLWPELAGKTLGILGYGHIGQALARRALAFDMNVCAVRRQAQEQTPPGVLFIGDLSRLDDVLHEADFLAITLGLSGATHNLLDARRIALMKPSAYLINVARAEIVDEDALYAALVSRRIAGAALDVWYRYPSSAQPTLPARQPFHELPNVLLTPHSSGWTEGMLSARANLIADNIERISRGEAPLNAVDLTA